GAVAALFEAISAGNRAIGAGDAEQTAVVAAGVRRMLDVLGLDPDSAEWAGVGPGASPDKLEPVVDGLVQAMLNQRAEARARKDWAAADAIRDTLSDLGLTVEDTQAGARWSL
ncbi:MAG: cysteine--tRNA ligase, partial [Acidipropionibacterium jensenii]|nr:cysteine--tRNA ligase [Acidipropionibacterium jensenii]